MWFSPVPAVHVFQDSFPPPKASSLSRGRAFFNTFQKSPSLHISASFKRTSLLCREKLQPPVYLAGLDENSITTSTTDQVIIV